jgi:hypothetical protein
VASIAAEETDEVESTWQGHREFWDKKQNDTRWAPFYRFKNINSGL